MSDASFAPVLRFSVCSDLHIKEANDEQTKRLRQLIRTTYAIAENDPSYPAVDAFLFAGDLTNGGTKAQFEAFRDVVQSEVQTGTRILTVIAKNHDNWEKGRNARKTGLQYCRSLLGLPTDTHFCIGGIHFIGISTCEKIGRYYSAKQKRWLKRLLRTIEAETPDTPIIIAQHEHVRDTVYGSSAFDGWGNTYFKKIFRRYPQIIHFSGHSHYPLNDPRSIFQKDFTAVGTGALSYAEFTVGSERCVHPPQSAQISQGWIVEVDAQNRVRLRGFDFLSGGCLCTYILSAPADKTKFSFTAVQQKQRSKAPAFPENAALTVEETTDTYRIICPAAESQDDFPVFLYRAVGQSTDGTVVSESYTLHNYWYVQQDAFYSIELPKQSTLQQIKVTAENAYGMASAALEKQL